MQRFADDLFPVPIQAGGVLSEQLAIHLKLYRWPLSLATLGTPA